MFRNAIYETELSSEIANGFFQNITGDSYDGDNSFVSTLRALLAPRLGEDDKIEFSVHRRTSRQHDLTKLSVQTVRSLFSGDEYYFAQDNQIALFEFSDYDDRLNELFTKKFSQAFDGWERIEKVTEFFKHAFSILCFINPETKSVILITEPLGFQRFHYLQCATVVFFPWYFSEAKVTEEEMSLITSLREKTDDKYLDAIHKIALVYDFRAEFIKKHLAGFENRFVDEEIIRLTNKIEDLNAQVEQYYNSISAKISEIQDCDIRVLGLRQKKNEGTTESELMNYFLSNKSLILLYTSPTTMRFCVLGYLSYYEEDAAEAGINNLNSVLYTNTRYFTKEDEQRFWRAVFIDKILKIRSCGIFDFDTRGASVNAIQHYDYSDIPECKTYIPNPHLHHYSCLGDYKRHINNMLMEHNYIMAVEQTIASNMSLNFNDGAVMDRFPRDLFDEKRNTLCIETSDGNIISVTDAINMLKENENGEDN